MAREHIRGGLASGRDPRAFDAAQLRKGIAVELEHVVRRGKRATKRDRAIAKEIAMDHLVEHPRYYDYLEEAERKMEMATNPAKHKVSLLRRQEALELATEVATRGWKNHRRKGDIPEYWDKEVPGGTLNIIESSSRMYNYELQHVAESGIVTDLGKSRGSLRDAQVKAILESMKRKLPVVNPQAVRNRAPPRAQWMSQAVRHPGKLSKLAAKLGFEKKPFMSRSLAEQKQILDACMHEYGYRSCLGSTMLLAQFPAIKRDPKMSRRAEALREYLVSKYGGPGSFGPRQNPPDGEWDAVPAILMHIDLGKVKLTSRQVTELELETR